MLRINIDIDIYPIPSAGKYSEQLELHTLMTGIQNGIAALGKKLAVPHKVRWTLT